MTEFEKYIKRYFDLVPNENWIDEMIKIGNETLDIYNQLSEADANFAYDIDKWSLKTLLQHLIDTERVFVYRALRFSRLDQSIVSGFDENSWADRCGADDKELMILIKEFDLVRQSTILFFEHSNKDSLEFEGRVHDNPINAKTIGKLIVGHNIHHLNIIKERYLPLIKKN